jgi:hypothetical protein
MCSSTVVRQWLGEHVPAATKNCRAGHGSVGSRRLDFPELRAVRICCSDCGPVTLVVV